MKVKEAIYTRRATRAFTGDAVDDAALRDLIDAAIQAPSAVNEQPWAFFVVREKALLAQISNAAKAFMLASSPAGLLSHHFESVLGDAQFDIFYGAPALIVIASSTTNPWATENCALAAENLMLAARAKGLGTCWIGFARDWLRTPAGKAALGMPEGYLPVAPIIVGHPKGPTTPVPRKAPEIHWVSSSKAATYEL